jgi:hypothetical protein
LGFGLQHGLLDEVSLSLEVADGWGEMLLTNQTGGRRAWKSGLRDGLEQKLVCHSKPVWCLGLVGGDEAVWPQECGFQEGLRWRPTHKVLLDTREDACVITCASMLLSVVRHHFML